MVEKPKVARINSTEIGAQLDVLGRTASDLPAESLMLTGDENIIDIRFTVQWQITNPR